MDREDIGKFAEFIELLYELKLSLTPKANNKL